MNKVQSSKFKDDGCSQSAGLVRAKGKTLPLIKVLRALRMFLNRKRAAAEI